MRLALVPRAAFRAEARLTAADYAGPKLWAARPDIQGTRRNGRRRATAPTRPPTVGDLLYPSHLVPGARPLERALADPEADARTALFLRGQASVFNGLGPIWAPQYRQATFGAFLTTAADANRALDLAYGDVAAAFDAFLAQVGPDRPIVLAGHSQGALHLTRLLREKVAGTPIARRVVAAYVVGWPVSRTTDMAALGLPECRAAHQPRCLLSWQSFAEPADPSLIVDAYDATTGFDGRPRRGRRWSAPTH